MAEASLYDPAPQYRGIRRIDQYVAMPDGTRLAVTVFLPKANAPASFPVLLHQTRYWRAPELRWPLGPLTHGLIGPEGKDIKALILQGYGFVNVDVRGSGASFGSRAHPWTREEIADGVALADWIVAQPWSNGSIGVIGISYSSTAGEFLMYQRHPAVKAAFLMFSLYDVYTDIALPGGIPFQWFTETWGRANATLDQNKLPVDNWLIQFLVKGVAPVNEDRQALKEAMQEHLANDNVHERASEVEFRDDVFEPEKGDTVAVFSPYAHRAKLDQAPIPIYHYSGWWDGAYQWSAIRRFLNDGHPESRLRLGPWEHRGQFHISPGHSGKNRFSHKTEILRFFDLHLKGIDTGLAAEPPVHFYTMRAEQWQTADSWPPQSATKAWYLGEKRGLSLELPLHAGEDSHQFQAGLGIGEKSRWRSMAGGLTSPKGYQALRQHNERALCYTSLPLEQPLEISGHPQVSLWIKANEPDVHLFVYLEEVLPDGQVYYLTEGLLRAGFHGTQDEEPLYQDAVPARQFRAQDFQALRLGEPTEVMIPCFPTSYELQPGSCLRLAISLNDAHHFAVRGTENTAIEVLWGEAFSSRIWMR
ncbi:MAG: CocE/NonD family hydrolase [Bacteroidota bacterium]